MRTDMPDVTEQLRAELRRAVANRPPEEPAAYVRVVRRAARRRAAACVGTAAGLVVAMVVVLSAPRVLGPAIGGQRLDTATGGEPAGPPARACTPAGAGCREPAFHVTPASTSSGRTVEVAGSCRAVLQGRASAVNVLLSLAGSRGYTGTVRPDGAFRVRLELPWRLLPARYQVTVSCVAEAAKAGISGAAILGDRMIDVARPAAPASRRGTPQPGALNATLDPVAPGQQLQLAGGGCYLSALDGARGLVRVVLTDQTTDPPESPSQIPSRWYDAIRVEPGGDGSWTAAVRAPDSLSRGRPYDIYAFCTDDLGGIGFMYRTVYRVDFGRLRPIQSSGV
jgi:hypothetical protein